LYSPTLKEHIQIYTMPTDTTTFANGLPVFSSNDHLPYCFNVSFLLNGNPLCVMERGVSKVSSLLKLGGNEKSSPPDGSVALNLARHWLFPKDVFIQNFPSSVQAEDIKATEWYDRGLNEEQRVSAKLTAHKHNTDFSCPRFTVGRESNCVGPFDCALSHWWTAWHWKNKVNRCCSHFSIVTDLVSLSR
jgi:hypothetical protein